ncbi:unnamed protein product [Linum trigynum]|uniref:Uncharacterized protein n=1 Tax=Linum trigynum TaxID=586398 RepID=A0AAV2CYQ9_9ROSI
MVTMMRSVTSSSSLLVLSLLVFFFFFFFFFVLGFLFEFVFDDSEILLCVLESWVLLRYQSVSPDCLPLPNGKKPTSTVGTSGRSIPNGASSSPTGYEIKGFRYRSPSRTQDFHHHSSSSNGVAAGSPSRSDKREVSPPSRGGSGDMLLQWGQKKRARVSRSEIRALADESSSSGQARQQPVASKDPRRLDGSKLPAPSMQPPPPAAAQHPQQTTNGRGGNLRKETAALLPHRNLEKRSAGNGSPSRASGGGGSRLVSRSTTAGKRSPPTPDKVDKKAQHQQQQPTSRSSRDEKLNGSAAAAAALLHHHHQAAAAADHHHHGHGRHHVESTSGQFDHEGGRGGAAVHNNTAAAPVERLAVEWPRIFLSLSRKEKEDDFLVMKGTKLPQRPKKRAKNVDRGLQFCYPGMWLSDLTKSRYEVREKKSVKKQQKRRGLKGMESMDSESE